MNDKGRFLIVESLDGVERHFPHPDPTMLGRRDLWVPAAQAAVIDPLWLDDPAFIRAVNAKQIRLYRSDDVPALLSLDLPNEHRLDDLPVLEAIAQQITQTRVLNEYLMAAISVDVRTREGGTTIDRSYMQGTHLRFLRSILYRERLLQNRADLVGMLERRIEQIRAM